MAEQGKVTIKVVTVGKQDMPTEAMREGLEHVTQAWARKGWTMRAAVSRGGTIYLIFAKKERR